MKPVIINFWFSNDSKHQTLQVLSLGQLSLWASDSHSCGPGISYTNTSWFVPVPMYGDSHLLVPEPNTGFSDSGLSLFTPGRWTSTKASSFSPEHSSSWVPGALLSSEFRAFPHAPPGQTTHLFWHTALSLVQGLGNIFFKNGNKQKKIYLHKYVCSRSDNSATAGPEQTHTGSIEHPEGHCVSAPGALNCMDRCTDILSTTFAIQGHCTREAQKNSTDAWRTSKEKTFPTAEHKLFIWNPGRSKKLQRH